MIIVNGHGVFNIFQRLYSAFTVQKYCFAKHHQSRVADCDLLQPPGFYFFNGRCCRCESGCQWWQWIFFMLQNTPCSNAVTYVTYLRLEIKAPGSSILEQEEEEGSNERQLDNYVGRLMFASIAVMMHVWPLDMRSDVNHTSSLIYMW